MYPTSCPEIGEIIYNKPPTSGEVRDDALMDLYYGRMHEEYSARDAA